MTNVAIVGMACRYPDAVSPHELWENVLAGRRAFRRLPDERMRLEDYWSPDPAAPDRFYARNAAVIEGYEFDRVSYRIAGSTYRSTDLTHWLALDIAAQALADAGYPAGDGLPRQRTGVVVGNTLTGEFSRANLMRLRWPYVRRMVAAALVEQGWEEQELIPFLREFERSYKQPFPEVDEDTLAGGLSNTIAGRICNYFDLNGGGYTVDGACSSSLLSVATACKTLADGDLDVVIAGGVDLSIDPFEIIGFAKTGALAREEMRVYDRASNGFWPGEGCGMLTLMRLADAQAAGHRIYATIAGWGISSDGKGGITRPEVSGYQLALQRAYERAGFGVDTVPLFEGHGTGTEVGDATELQALSQARLASDPQVRPAAISSIKGMIGHTKAAAGVAGLVKAAMAIHHQVLPPAIGCVDPHPVLTEEPTALRVLRKAEPWPEDAPLRAGITAMGFGGINTHIVLDHPEPRLRGGLDSRTRAIARSIQDAELFVLAGDSLAELRERLVQLVAVVPRLSYAQLADLAAVLHRQLGQGSYRAAAVVHSPEEAERRLGALVTAIDDGKEELLSVRDGCFLGRVTGRPRIGLLFPGQGSGRGVSGGALRRRFASVDEVYQRAALPTGADVVATAVAQPRIVTGSLAGLAALRAFGLEPAVAVGHSLGEITALHWAGAMDEQTLLATAAARGRIMTEHSESGIMASISGPAESVEPLLAGEPVVIAGYNSPEHTVIAGPADATERVCEAARRSGLDATRLSVSHAFHSPLVAPAAGAFGDWLATREFGPVRGRVISTVSGDPLAADTDVSGLLHRQIIDPVQFLQAMSKAAEEVDLFVEVGPGTVLTGLARRIGPVPAVAMDTDNESLTSLLTVVGTAFVHGAEVAHEALWTGRLVRPLDLEKDFVFLASPCESAPQAGPGSTDLAATAEVEDTTAEPGPGDRSISSLDRLRALAAARVELPVDSVSADSRLLDDLHLSSISVGQLVNQASRELGLPASQAPANLATATLRELAEVLDGLVGAAPEDSATPAVAGVAAWVRPFAIDLVEAPVPARTAAESNGTWQSYYHGDHPFAEQLRRALESGGVGDGVLVCLPSPCREEDLALALAGAQAAVSAPAGGRLVLVQHGRGGSGLVKTAHLEASGMRTTIVDIPLTSAMVERVLAEVSATEGFVEAYYNESGVRRTPVLRPLPDLPGEQTRPPLGDGDVLLVTGGGKGITAECALALATDTGARLAVLGRSDPSADTELADNLARMRAVGPDVHYVQVDITDEAAVRAAVDEVGQRLGPVTAVLHGAGRNEPAGLANLDMDALRRTYAPKVDGLRAVLSAVDQDALRLLVTFGSIIGRAGLRGEGHYANANDWLADLTSEFSWQHPQCRTVCLEWSVWSGVGMGERLSVVESLLRDGVTAITPDHGVQALRELLARPDTPAVVVVTGRADGLDTIRYERPELPLLRFVERTLVYYPGVELVTEAELASVTDPYLDDHHLDGNLLLPAVIGMEAMTQVATALRGGGAVSTLEQIEFMRPVVAPPDGATTIRVAALRSGADQVEVAIRSSETNFSTDHFRATLRFDGQEVPAGPPEPTAADLPTVPLDPGRDMYGDVLFQGKRFQRLLRYRRTAARRAEADVAIGNGSWFSAFLPPDLLLGDPGARDALMHGIQVCVPDATLLPAGVARIHPGCARLSEAGELTLVASERHHEGDTYVYDVALYAPGGEVVERWDQLRLQAVRKKDGGGPWAPALLGPYLQRRLEHLIEADIDVVVEPDLVANRRKNTALALSRARGHKVSVRYRPDGRPQVAGCTVSAAHGAGLTLAVTGPGPDAIGCDVEPVAPRTTTQWGDLLGERISLAELLNAESEDSLDLAATRVWCAIECLQKAGEPPASPLTLAGQSGDGWAVFAAGARRVATFATSIHEADELVVFAFLV
jgi:enediyne polyketide synthase